jgi:hypothetical protein
MSLPVTIENSAIRLSVWPQIGGKISSLIDKADGFELLFNFPTELPEGSLYGKSYQAGWNAGWDECFPGISPGPYPRHPYEGVAVPDHGELWSLPTTAVPTRDGLTTVWHGLRFGYTFTRKLFLDGSSIVAEYTVLNRAPFEFSFLWCAHLLMAMSAPVELQLPGGAWTIDHGTTDHATEGDAPKAFDWPQITPQVDLSRPALLPEKAAWKVFCGSPIAQPAVIRYPSRRRRITLEYDARESRDDERVIGGPAAYWGVWVNTGGWGAQRHFGVEPTTGRFDDLAQSVKDHSAGTIPPMGRREWEVRLTLGDD